MSAQTQHYEDKLAYETDSFDLKEALDDRGNVVVIDARAPTAYQKRHIPTAVNVPHKTMASADLSFIPKDALVVVYCDGIGCNASTKGARNMLQLGYRVKELMGGLDWWVRDGYPVAAGAHPGSFDQADAPAAAQA